MEYISNDHGRGWVMKQQSILIVDDDADIVQLIEVHQRQDPSKTSMFLSEGLPLYFREIEGTAMPNGWGHLKDGKESPIGDVISPK